MKDVYASFILVGVVFVCYNLVRYVTTPSEELPGHKHAVYFCKALPDNAPGHVISKCNRNPSLTKVIE
jgi:hypothetical protein